MDERWLVPHFEKMLADNALLIEFMTDIWQFNRNALCRQRIEETVDWLLRDLKLDDAFAAGLEADSEGEEGKFISGAKPEIDAALAGTFAPALQGGLWRHPRRQPSWAAIFLRRMGHTQPQLTEADEALLAKQRGMLLAARDKRVRPGARRNLAGRLERLGDFRAWPRPARRSSAPTGCRPRSTPSMRW